MNRGRRARHRQVYGGQANLGAGSDQGAPTPPPPDDIVSKWELARRLGVSGRTVQEMDLPTIRIGYRTVRYSWTQVVEVLRERAL